MMHVWAVMPKALIAVAVLACCVASARSVFGQVPKEAPMVMTVLEARVPADRLADVELVFREGMSPLPLIWGLRPIIHSITEEGRRYEQATY
jgi:hypothetical protein